MIKSWLKNKGGPLLKSKITELADKVDHSMETLAAAMPKDSFCSMVDLVSGLNDAKSRGQGATGSPDESKAFLKKVFPGITDEDVSTIMTRADEEAQEVLDCDTSTPNCREERLMKQDDKFLKQVDSLAENLAESEASFVQLATKFGANVPHDHLSELTEMQRRENTWAALQIMDNKTAWEEPEASSASSRRLISASERGSTVKGRILSSTVGSRYQPHRRWHHHHRRCDPCLDFPDGRGSHSHPLGFSWPCDGWHCCEESSPLADSLPTTCRAS